MGQSVEIEALEEAVRETLELFLSDHPACEHAEIVIRRSAQDGATLVCVNGISFRLVFEAPEGL